ncbi:MotA/TolQ/ExbB proton channel family protein [Planctomicrobium sp. SH668]|uniref:MotA/TolQ/ExbB proton channel family protein n=1 Tax=Planctomicrobium sp. SH668 TaxID=3448126 RepID=UPI003F5C0BA0
MSGTHRSNNLFVRALDPSFLGGAAATVAFYAFVWHESMRETMLHKYTTEHAVEYVIVALFLWGLADVVLRVFSFPGNFGALKNSWMPKQIGKESVSKAEELLKLEQQQSRSYQNSRVGQRYAQSLQYIVDEQSAAGLRDHLHLLSELDHDRTHGNYSIARFIASVTPILGFLGTVVHFGTALSGISFDKMSEKLPIIVAEMGTAFNTTTVALGASMMMMLAVFVCERIERSIISSIDLLVKQDLLNRFATHDANLVPFLATLESANAMAMRAIEQTLQGQVAVWTRAMDGLFQRFEERQQVETLAWENALKLLQTRHEANGDAQDERVRKMLSQVEISQAAHMEVIRSTLEKSGSIGKEIRGLTETLETVARGEGRLAELQGTLTTNLRVIRETQQIDEAMHGLTAAIHLLTARHRKSDGQEAAAA